MRILLLAAANDIHTVRWANTLSEHRNEVHVCYVSNQKPTVNKYNDGVVLHELYVPAPLGYYLNVPQLKRIISKCRPDVINVHYSSGYGTLGRLVKTAPYLISVYGGDVYDFPYKSKFNMYTIKKNLYAADEIASTSIAMAKQTTKLIDVELSNIHITPFGVDTDRFLNANIDKNDNEIIIGTIKKLSPKYGIEYGILAFNHLIKNLMRGNKNGKSVKYYIYGEGEQKEELKKLVRELNLEESIQFKGRIPNNEVPAALNKMDIFLGTSILDSESFGVAVVEAMACEVPVIVTDVDGFKEVVDGGNAGIMVPRKDYVAMAEKILYLINSPETRKELGHRQRERVMKEYRWTENVITMEKIYNNLIKNVRN